jgi:DNA-binding HxlR family transcriptional regulator
MSFDDEIPEELSRILERISFAIDMTEKLEGKVAVRPDRWSVLIFKSVKEGNHRFEEIQEHLGTPRNILTDRLTTMLKLGILTKVQYSEFPKRFEYHINPDGDGPSGQPAMVRV